MSLPEQLIIDFDGAYYNRARDQKRLTGQIRRVYNALTDGRWKTLTELEQETGDPQASISAQLRNLRKPRFGGNTVETKRIEDQSGYKYRLVSEPEAPDND